MFSIPGWWVMLVHGKAATAAETRFQQGDKIAGGFGAMQASGIALAQIGFSGSWADWCECGFSICESYLIEAQGLFLNGDLADFLAMAEAQADLDLVDEALAHANALLLGAAFCRLGGRLEVSRVAPVALNWPVLANLWRAMESSKGDMRMPRLDPGFERKLRAALRLS